MPRRILTEEERIAMGLPDPDTARKMLEAANQSGVQTPSGEDGGWTAKDWARLSLEIAGGVGGAAVGTAVGGLPGAAVLGGAGTAAGSLLSETFDPSEHPIRRARDTATLAGLGEGIGGPILNRVLGGGTAKTLEEGGAGFISEALDAGLRPSIGRSTKNRLLDVLETIGEGSIFGGGRLSHAAEKVDEFYQGATRAFVDTFRSGASKEAIEDLASTAFEGGAEAFSAAGASLYNTLDNAVMAAGKGNALVDMAPLLKRVESAQARGFDPTAANRVGRLIKNRISEFGEGNLIPFKLAHEIRSEFLGMSRSSQALIGDISRKGPSLGKEFAGVIDSSMEAAAKKAGGAVESAWRNADAFWRNGKEVFNSSIIKALTRRDPQSIFSALKRAEPRDIRKVRNVINDEALWGEIKGELLTDIIRASEDPSANLVGTGFLRRLKNFGDERLTEIMSPAEINRLKQLGNSLRIAQGKIGENIPGKIFIQLNQAGAVVLGLQGTLGFGKAGAILMAPYVAARTFTNPAFIKWATLGARFKPGTKQAINAASQMMAIALAEGGRTIDADSAGQGPNTPQLPFSATLGGPR